MAPKGKNTPPNSTQPKFQVSNGLLLESYLVRVAWPSALHQLLWYLAYYRNPDQRKFPRASSKCCAACCAAWQVFFWLWDLPPRHPRCGQAKKEEMTRVLRKRSWQVASSLNPVDRNAIDPSHLTDSEFIISGQDILVQVFFQGNIRLCTGKKYINLPADDSARIETFAF
jgi:hypothetical protein